MDKHLLNDNNFDFDSESCDENEENIMSSYCDENYSCDKPNNTYSFEEYDAENYDVMWSAEDEDEKYHNTNTIIREIIMTLRSIPVNESKKNIQLTDLSEKDFIKCFMKAVDINTYPIFAIFGDENQLILKCEKNNFVNPFANYFFRKMMDICESLLIDPSELVFVELFTIQKFKNFVTVEDETYPLNELKNSERLSKIDFLVSSDDKISELDLLTIEMSKVPDKFAELIIDLTLKSLLKWSPKIHYKFSRSFKNAVLTFLLINWRQKKYKIPKFVLFMIFTSLTK